MSVKRLYTVLYFCLGFSCCPYYPRVRYSRVSASRESTVLGMLNSSHNNFTNTDSSYFGKLFVYGNVIKHDDVIQHFHQ